MSIRDFNKIGDWLKKNQADIAIVVGFVLVAVTAFGVGRLSAPQIVRNPIVIEEPNASSSSNIFGSVSQPLLDAAGDSAQNITSNKGLFVASKNSRLYHWPWCAPAKNIKPENQIWFQSEAQAQAAGYSPSSCIASQAPAGYKSL